MEHKEEQFSVVIPATLEKSEDGSEWRVYGLASTPKKDLQGEVIDLKGLDLTPIANGKGVFNVDHKRDPENTVGVIDKFKKSEEGLYLGGYLFKNHDRAKALYQIMGSLKKSDRGRVGMSVEGIIKKRSGQDGKLISKAVITSCALTMNPINPDTYVDLVKSFSAVEFSDDMIVKDEVIDTPKIDPQAVDASQGMSFTTDQVVALLHKALSVGSAYATSTPGQLTGGDALATEDLEKDKECTKKAAPKDEGKAKEAKGSKKLKKASPELYKSWMKDLLDQLQKLHPEASRSEIWETVKDRLNQRFPSESTPKG